MVPDGMVSHAVGELASKIACYNIPHIRTRPRPATPEAITKPPRCRALIHTRAAPTATSRGWGRGGGGGGRPAPPLLLLHLRRPDRARRRLPLHLSRNHRVTTSSPSITAWSGNWVLRNHLTPSTPLAVPKNVDHASLGPDPSGEVDTRGPPGVEFPTLTSSAPTACRARSPTRLGPSRQLPIPGRLPLPDHLAQHPRRLDNITSPSSTSAPGRSRRRAGIPPG